MDDWITALKVGDSESAWDLFVDRYRRVIFAAIYHYTREPDDAMDIFAWVCESLRDHDLRRLRQYADRSHHRARVSTWLITVVRHLTVDWFRHRDGRRRIATVAESLSPLHRRIFELVYLERRRHVEAYEVIRATMDDRLTFGRFLTELRATHQRATSGPYGRVIRAMAQSPDMPTTQAPKTGETAERRAVLDDAVDSLSTEEREAVELYVLDEQPATTVAAALGLPNAKAVYNRVYRALSVLRERLEKAGIHRGDL